MSMSDVQLYTVHTVTTCQHNTTPNKWYQQPGQNVHTHPSPSTLLGNIEVETDYSMVDGTQ